ncbi:MULTISPECIES: GMC family oxidoreductase [Sulfitobacter]|uniref:GMC family oxidoreductase n=1 Tax=Sulfitobacter TaxID=60136 RepID=UPI002307D75F|nr:MULTISPECIES: GMC family oxidoreductase N-terminal domain-containing protein [Sulfitobacter]MDF3382645.1 choline dehydrogenase [Sulfitobacter sp. Ks11]MDF3386064.1 choline dehydrogenase [Sulfitobacter sp. M85]MDF3389483.1 choline dehydrogenase [Sulfitobacter sp. Ks16]MDF3400120.1 choline dehydrogenase [Sulfitobacter sp. KE39]MDF3403541.1 choline dehydrogenase [Sulfitobacter sp. Ks35]
MQGYDYVIVGSGTAGSTLANRLSAGGHFSVLVLEAGGEDRGFWLKLPVGYFRSIYNERVSHLYRSQPDDGIAGRQMDCPRGRVVGGSSSINGLIYIRGQREDYDDWAALGADGWGYGDVLPYFRSVESYQGPPSQFRGAHGPLSISDLRNENPACHDWLEAARNAGYPSNLDFNGAESYGVGSYQLTLRGRWRDSAATAFLKPALTRKNLTLRTRAQVTRILFEGDRAVGVAYLKEGREYEVRADQEVLLCGGAVQTPQLLQLSGIGPETVLEKAGIKPQHVSPEVGRNLQDHLQMRTIVELSDKKDSLNDHVWNPLKLAGIGLDWLFNARGPLTVGAGQVGGAVRTKYAQGDRPDLQLFVMPLSVDKPGAPLHRYSGFTTSLWQCHPESRGSIQITSADPFADPEIRLNYLSTQRDRDVIVEGVRIVRQLYNEQPFRDRWKNEVVPGSEVQTDEEILAAVRRMAGTVYHLVGTCRMGSDDCSVVDPQLRVRGVRGLRVVDASVMPKITSANTNAPTYMIAEKGAAIILGEAGATHLPSKI